MKNALESKESKWEKKFLASFVQLNAIKINSVKNFYLSTHDNHILNIVHTWVNIDKNIF